MKKFKSRKHREKIIDRIQKILAIADKTSFEEEAKTAMKMAKGLMKSYGLSLSEVEMKDEISDNVISETTDPTGRLPNWEKVLGLAVSTLCDTKMIIHQVAHRKYNLMFIGYKEDVKLSITLYNIFKIQMKNLAYKAYNTDRSLKNSFLLGLSDCLRDRAEHETQQAVEDTPKYGALVVVKEDEINKFINEHLNRLTKANINSNSVDPIAYQEGYQEGKLMDLKNKGKLE